LKALIEIKEAGNCLAQDVELKVTKRKGEMKIGEKEWKSSANYSSAFNDGFDD
jgi:hypothetical protein